MSIEYPSQRVSDVYSAIYQLDSVTICSFCSMQHEITGCDTTSAHYGQGKKKAFKLLLKYPYFTEMCRRVQWPLHIRMLWGYYICRRRVPSGALWNSEGNIVHEQGQISLFHEISRCPFHQNLPHQKKNATVVYHQVQTWLGWDLPLTEWGWIVSMDSFRQFLLASL